MAAAFVSLTEKMGIQHQNFLDQVANTTFDALRKENERLIAEIESLKVNMAIGELLYERGKIAPMLPPVPTALPSWLDDPAASLNMIPNTPDLYPDEPVENCLRAPSCETKIYNSIDASKAENMSKRVYVDTRSSVSIGGDSAVSGGGFTRKPSIENRPRLTTAMPVRPHTRPMTSLMTMNNLLSTDLDDRRRFKERRRIAHVFGYDCSRAAHEATISPESFAEVMQRRNPLLRVSHNRLKDILRELAEIAQSKMTKVDSSDDRCIGVGCIGVHAMAEIIWLPQLGGHIRRCQQGEVDAVTAALRMPTSEEIIHEVTRGTSIAAEDRDPVAMQDVKPSFFSFSNWERNLNAVVAVVAFLNVVSMGISVDQSPNNQGWFWFEFFCVIIFLAECIIKLRNYGCRTYFCGESASWNIIDLIVTSIALMQVLVESITLFLVENFSGKDAAQLLKVAVMLRSVRLLRVVRLVKLVRSPILRDMANMLVGFVIGIPSLFWVLVFLILILCMSGLLLRIAFGPERHRMKGELETICGPADDLLEETEVCKLKLLYGDEFFGNLSTSMFTVFRWMIGDYGTKGGKSLVVAFATGYGYKFMVFFVCFMIIIIFGLFNILTAIFVESTVAGLKHNDVKRKYTQQYERKYVQDKLKMLLLRIREIMFGEGMIVDLDEGNGFEINEEMFLDIVADDGVKEVLQDLDIEVLNLPAMFCTFDGDDSGLVTMQEMIEGIMKLRGEPQKMDVVGCWVSTRLLHEKLDDMKVAMERCPSESGRGEFLRSRSTSRRALQRSSSYLHS